MVRSGYSNVCGHALQSHCRDTWHASPALNINFSYGHLFDDTRNVNQTSAMTGNALRGTLIGTTKSDVDVIGLSLDYRWQ